LRSLGLPGKLRDTNPAADPGMRPLLALAFFSVCLAGCTPFIPVVDRFGTSALKPTGNIPPEFAEFNNYDPAVNALLADQICATPYILQTQKSLRATPGELIAQAGRCEIYQIRLDNLAEHFLPDP
jgi:hypothetical protein